VSGDGLPVLYLMCPIPLYGSPALTAARGYPFAELTGCPVRVECAADLWCCNKCWVAAWPGLRARIRFGVFLDHLGGWVGRGVFAEVMELMALGRPVWWLSPGGPVDSFRFGDADYRDWGGRYRPVMAVPAQR
jgi:hypothetical protein